MRFAARRKGWARCVCVLTIGLAMMVGSQAGTITGAEPADTQPLSIIMPSPLAGATAEPSIAIDGSGHTHVAFEIALGGEVIYATCTDNCTQTDSWTSVQVGANGSLGSRPQLQLTPSGRPRLMYVRDDLRCSFRMPQNRREETISTCPYTTAL